MDDTRRERIENLADDIAEETGADQRKILGILLKKFSLKPNRPVDTFAREALKNTTGNF